MSTGNGIGLVRTDRTEAGAHGRSSPNLEAPPGYNKGDFPRTAPRLSRAKPGPDQNAPPAGSSAGGACRFWALGSAVLAAAVARRALCASSATATTSAANSRTNQPLSSGSPSRSAGALGARQAIASSAEFGTQHARVERELLRALGAPALEREQPPVGVAVHAPPAARRRASAAGRARPARPSRTAASTSRPSRRSSSSVMPLISASSPSFFGPALRDLDQRAVAEHLERRAVHLARAPVAHQVELAQHRRAPSGRACARP